MKIFCVDKNGRLDVEQKDAVVKILKKGGVVVLPTDTSYGLAALINKPAAVKKVFSLKGREKNKVSSIVVRSKAQALQYGRISPRITKLWAEFLPGALTLVVQAKKKIKLVTAADDTIAIRRINTPVVNQLLKALPAPVTITSANKSGQKGIYSFKGFLAQYKQSQLPAAFIDAGDLPKGAVSTVVKLTGKIDILRPGKIPATKIKKVLWPKK